MVTTRRRFGVRRTDGARSRGGDAGGSEDAATGDMQSGSDSIRPGTARWTLARPPSAAPTRRSRRTTTCGGDSAFFAESTPSAEGSLSATFTARSAHTEGRAASSGRPLGRCSEALVSGIDGQPSATRLRGQRPATYCGRRMPPAAALSRRARRGGDSIRPGPAGQTRSRSPTALTQLVSAQIVPGIDVLALSTPTTAGCLQLARLRLRIRGGAHPRRAAHPGGAASCSSPALRSQQSAMRFQAHGICCGWRMPSTATLSRRVLRGGVSI